MYCTNQKHQNDFQATLTLMLVQSVIQNACDWSYNSKERPQFVVDGNTNPLLFTFIMTCTFTVSMFPQCVLLKTEFDYLLYGYIYYTM